MDFVLYFSFAEMRKCWLNNPDDRPTFSELVSIMGSMLTAVSDYTEVDMNLANTEQKQGKE